MLVVPRLIELWLEQLCYIYIQPTVINYKLVFELVYSYSRAILVAWLLADNLADRDS